MSELDRKLKTALDESRLLILGVQVLFGFQFQAVFQDMFPAIDGAGYAVHGVCLGLFVIALASLVAPSMVHQLTFDGANDPRMLALATWFAGASLLPVTLGIGGSLFVVLQRLAGNTASVLSCVAVSGLGIGLLYGAGLAARRRKPPMPDKSETSIETKIDQLLTEARVIIPGGQALLGFQFIAVLTKSFSELPEAVQYVHIAGLFSVVVSIFLLMTPAAMHRIAFHGESSPEFFRIGSALVIASALPLALGISADVFVVVVKLTDRVIAAAAAGALCIAVLTCAWYVYPLVVRR